MKADVPATAMGDIAFNLLIFFVILARANDDSHLKWNPAEAQNLEGSKGAKVTVVIDIDGKIYLNSQQKSETELADAIGDELGDASPGNRVVYLKIDKNVTAPRFEPVIEAVSQAGGELIHILNEDNAPPAPTPAKQPAAAAPPASP
jgi:biopolymer transport protein ExbD